MTGTSALALLQGEHRSIELLPGQTEWDYNDFFCIDWHILEDGRISIGVDPLGDEILDEAVIDVFSRGHCHSLALAIQELTGCELVATHDGDDGWQHVAVEISDGVFLDIKGTHCEDGLLEDDYCEDATLEAIGREDVEDWVERGEYRPLRIEDAMPFARALCALHGVETGELAIAA